MLPGERSRKIAVRRLGDGEPGFLAAVTHLQRAKRRRDAAGRNAFGGQAAPEPGFKVGERGGGIVARSECLLGEVGDPGKADAQRAQDPGVRAAQDPAHAEFPRERASVLAARAAERHEGVGTHVVAARRSQFLDRSGHRGIRDAQETGGQFVAGVRLAGGGDQGREEFVQAALGRESIERERESRDAAKVKVEIRDGERTAGPVTRGPGRRSGGTGADAEFFSIEPADRSSAGGDGFDFQHARLQAHPAHGFPTGGFGLVAAGEGDAVPA